MYGAQINFIMIFFSDNTKVTKIFNRFESTTISSAVDGNNFIDFDS